jgi:2,4-dienoyl-CoA reductase-like NADH-dependent reductase (Old Yellow Enzyme family)
VSIIELKHLFQPGKIGNVLIKNRIVRSATWESRATNDGYVTDSLIEFYEELAKGGTGLIITGYLAVDPLGAQTIRMVRIDNDSYITGQKKLVKSVHEHADVKIAAQISHTGNNVISRKLETVGPSAIRDPITKKFCRELKNNEIKQIIENFIEAGIRIYECGYDMLQIQACHGYLISDFISPFTNRRTDEYGGSLMNRLKILLEIVNGIRDNVGKSFPIIVKLITQDFLGEGKGLTLEEGVEIIKILVELGIDAIEPTSGRTSLRVTNNKSFPSVNFSSPEDENYFLPITKKIKQIMKDCPLILMGGIRNPLSADKLLEENLVDFISLSRPLLIEPDLPNRWKNGDLSPSLCTNCNACFGTGTRGKVYCTIKKNLTKQK